MIRNFSDHAANERTFLAWIRTAIAIMAFGFVIEKFNLFMHFSGLGGNVAQAAHHLKDRLAGVAGLALIAFGALLLAIATHRFLKTAKEIDAPETMPGVGSRMDVVLATLLAVLGGTLFVYLAQNVIATL